MIEGAEVGAALTQALSQKIEAPGQGGRGAPSLLREDRGAVRLLTLNRPEARNCLSEDLIAALHAAIAAAGADDTVRAVVITGAGTAFSSGHDLRELTGHRSDPDRGRAYYAKIMGACAQLMLWRTCCTPRPRKASAPSSTSANRAGRSSVSCRRSVSDWPSFCSIRLLYSARLTALPNPLATSRAFASAGLDTVPPFPIKPWSQFA